MQDRDKGHVALVRN